MAPLLGRMKAEETRKAALLEELATLDGAAGLGDLALARTQRVLRAKAADVRAPRAPARRSEGRSRRVVQTLTLAPVGRGRARGYRFAGTGCTDRCLGKLPHRVVAPTGFEPVFQPPWRTVGVSSPLRPWSATSGLDGWRDRTRCRPRDIDSAVPPFDPPNA